MKTYGGFLPLDACGKEFYSENRGYDIVRFNAARYALAAAFKDGAYKKLWIPVYTCQSIYEVLESEKIEYSTYNINTSFLPELEAIGEKECIVITNYYGIGARKLYTYALEKFRNIIFDNTQSFYEKPILKDNVYNIYSPRKFVGVSDGAYLISKNIHKCCDVLQDLSYGRATYLFKSTECGTNMSYREYLQGEQDLAGSGTRKMSVLTRTILGNIDYGAIREKRRRNFEQLHKELGRENELKVDMTEECPMVYPFLTEKKGETLRDYLVENKVFIPQWWKWVVSNKNANDFERRISQYIYPLPIDQRYSEEDMKALAQVVKGGLK